MRTLPVEYVNHADIAETAQIQRALTAVEAVVYETKFEPLKARMIIPVDGSDAPGAEWTSYIMLTAVGVAKLVTSRGQDLPKVNVFRKEYQRKYFPIGASYDYTVDELRGAQFGATKGGPVFGLDTSLATACRRAIDFGIDKVGALGSATSATITGLSTSIGADVGMLGLLNQPNFSSYTPATAGAGGLLTFASKTPDEILADMNGMLTSIIVSTREAFAADVLVLPVTQYRLVSTKRMGDGSDRTILELFKAQNPGVEVVSWNFAAGAGTNGTDRMIAFWSDPMAIAFKISVDFEQMPLEYRNRVFKTDCLAKTAGVVSRYPISGIYGDGI